MSKEINQTTCPECELVSAYFDGEIDPASAEFAHIKACPECKKRLQSYQNISDILKEELLSATPKNLSVTILAEVKRRNKARNQHNFRFHFSLKFAAMFILIGLVLIMLLPKKTAETDVKNKIRPLPEFLNLNVQKDNYMTTMKLPNNSGTADNNGTIDWDHFLPASTQPRNEIYFIDENAKEKPAIISPVVKQIWIVKDLNAGMKEFAKLAEKDHIKFTKNRNGNSEINLKISKLQLVELVRKCHKTGFKLLSPTQPQPEQNIFTGNKNDIVSYHATLTQK